LTRQKRLYYQAVSLHEAAHAFYWEKMGCRVKEVWMKKRKYYCQATTRWMTSRDYQGFLKAFLAGPAISMMSGIPIKYGWNSKDLDEARDILRYFRKGLSKKEIDSYIIRLTKKINKQIKSKHFKKIERLADALLEKRHLTGKRVRKLLKS
jgi:hypothetical protein